VFVACKVVIIGGVDMMTQALQLAKKPHIVIGNYMPLITVLTTNKMLSYRRETALQGSL